MRVKKPLTSLVKADTEWKILNPCEMEMRESITFFFTHIEFSKQSYYGRLIIKKHLA